MKYPIVVALSLGLASGIVSAKESAIFKADENEDSPRVVAFYKTQCAQWSQAEWIEAGRREAFVEQCAQDMKEVWPVGVDSEQGE